MAMTLRSTASPSLIAWLALLLVGAPACGAGTVTSDGLLADGGACDGDGGGAEPTCKPAVAVGTANELWTILANQPASEETTVRTATGAALSPTSDIRFTQRLTLSIADFVEAHPACASADGEVTDGGTTSHNSVRCTETTFLPELPFHVVVAEHRLTPTMAGGIDGSQGIAFPNGVTCLAFTNEAKSSSCARIRIEEGTTVRFQRIAQRLYFGSTLDHQIRIVRPCATPCTLDEQRCAASSTCIRAGVDMCTLCQGRDVLACACATACGTAADGTHCEGWDSDDTVFSTTCKAGKCFP